MIARDGVATYSDARRGNGWGIRMVLFARDRCGILSGESLSALADAFTSSYEV